MFSEGVIEILVITEEMISANYSRKSQASESDI